MIVVPQTLCCSSGVLKSFGGAMASCCQDFDEFREICERDCFPSEKWVPTKKGYDTFIQFNQSRHTILRVRDPAPLLVSQVATEIQVIDRAASEHVSHRLKHGFFLGPHLYTEGRSDAPPEPVPTVRTTLGVEATLSPDEPGDVLGSDVLHRFNVEIVCDRKRTARRPP